ncbi:MAG: preprotein translocase subunit YajC [Actinobacteria bacterium]|jgi:preprotein translocase subunit YajC|nr:preprotein translocase subunit YajC [Actinomycetota bacterium]MBU1494492.1 preprotein translocase subunit YajC [Actinomycetota bacterium]
MLSTFEILAQAEDTAAGGTQSIITTVMLFAVIGGLFWFLLIRPQRTRAKRQQAVISSLEVGDEVHTIGGIIGTIEFMDDASAVLRLEGGGRMRVVRRAIADKYQPPKTSSD